MIWYFKLLSQNNEKLPQNNDLVSQNIENNSQSNDSVLCTKPILRYQVNILRNILRFIILRKFFPWQWTSTLKHCLPGKWRLKEASSISSQYINNNLPWLIIVGKYKRKEGLYFMWATLWVVLFFKVEVAFCAPCRWSPSWQTDWQIAQ